MPDSPVFDAVVIGAGAVGLAIARALSMQQQSLAVLEREDVPGHHTSSRNSEVVHAGFYYPSGTLKARLCVRGRDLLYDYCGRRGITARRCGKLVVASDDSGLVRLHQLLEQGRKNGVTDLRILGREQTEKLVPGINAVAALHSPSTGILDSHGYLDSLQHDILANDGIIVCRSRFLGASFDGEVFTITFEDDEGQHAIRARRLVNAGGLFASDVASKIDGLNASLVPETRWAKGNYFSLSGRPPSQMLVYPLPEENGLGIHLTLDISGSARFGPDVVWTDKLDYSADDDRRAAFIEAVTSYLPAIDPDRLQPAWAGIRPKAFVGGKAANDFVIHGPKQNGVPGLVQLFGIESPGLTASLAIAEFCVQLIDE